MRSIEQVVGANVAAVRKQRGRSSADFGADMAAVLGRPWTRQQVWDAEQGRRSFRIAEVVAIADVLGVSVVRLLEPGGQVAAVNGDDYSPSAFAAIVAGEPTPPAKARALARAIEDAAAALRGVL